MTIFRQRTLGEIAGEIEADSLAINNQAARHALGYMKLMGSIEAPFAAGPNGYGVVGSFLTHAIEVRRGKWLVV